MKKLNLEMDLITASIIGFAVCSVFFFIIVIAWGIRTLGNKGSEPHYTPVRYELGDRSPGAEMMEVPSYGASFSRPSPHQQARPAYGYGNEAGEWSDRQGPNYGFDRFSPQYDRTGSGYASPARSTARAVLDNGFSYFDDRRGSGVPSGTVFASSAREPLSSEELGVRDVYRVSEYDYETEFTPWEREEMNARDLMNAQSVLGWEEEGYGERGPRVDKRRKPYKHTQKEVTKCNICLGYIKPTLPLITCVCSKSYHVSCATRTGECPICGTELLDYEDRTGDNGD